ncbi:MAG: fused MFS/spermidine synthase [Cytophagales bacterium]|nr:fused MFS/spermidine synthase [Cytophagales bacterium]MDW8385016.1 fused MFS/spermidine synthase [Flammeovirgaceae bacterium]
MKTFVLKVLSYFAPICLQKIYSPINGWLEINLLAGKKVLDTSKSNFSYGSLQRILRRGLEEVDFSHIHNVLVLGAGGGSIVPTLRKDFQCLAPIYLVDIDEVVIRIAQEHFGLNQENNLCFFQSDAKEFLATTSNYFDLIVVDIFIEDTVPQKFLNISFWELVISRLSTHGYLLFNTMRHTTPIDALPTLQKFLNSKKFSVQILEQIECTNDILVAYQKSMKIA